MFTEEEKMGIRSLVAAGRKEGWLFPQVKEAMIGVLQVIEREWSHGTVEEAIFDLCPGVPLVEQHSLAAFLREVWKMFDARESDDELMIRLFGYAESEFMDELSEIR